MYNYCTSNVIITPKIVNMVFHEILELFLNPGGLVNVTSDNQTKFV